MQTSYSNDQNAGMLGMLADSGFKHTDSKIAKTAIPVGRGVTKVVGEDNQVRLPAANQGTIVFDADFVALNTIDLNLNGVAMDTVTYATSHDATAAALAAEIATMDGVASAILDPADTDNRTIIITGDDDTVITVTGIVVALGASQANGTFTAGTRDGLYGISQFSQALESGLPDEDEIVTYPALDVANVLRRGSIYVQFETAFDPDTDTLYCRFIANGATGLIGQFRNDSDSGKAFAVTGNVAVKSTLTAAGLGIIEVNRPV